MPSPTYKQNKEHIYKWRKQNSEEYKIIQMRCYYKKKIQCPIWREIKYEFLDILI
jgi:hypothetical protein